MKAWIVGNIMYILLTIGLLFNIPSLLHFVSSWNARIRLKHIDIFSWYYKMGLYESVIMLEPEICLGFWGDTIHTRSIEKILKGTK